jgi:Tol biopolymer transport system component
MQPVKAATQLVAGDFVYTRVGYGIFAHHAADQSVTQISNESGDSQPDVSPDGSKIAFAHGCGDVQLLCIYLMGSDGSGRTQVTFNVAPDPNNANIGNYDSRPRWSPDGQWIAFIRSHYDSQDYTNSVMKVRPDGSGLTTLTGPSVADTTDAASWSPPDASGNFRIAYSKCICAADPNNPTAGQTAEQIYIMNADGTNNHLVAGSFSPYGDAEPAWSPDGSRIYFSSSQTASGAGGYAGSSLMYFSSPDGFASANVSRNVLLSEGPDDSFPRVTADGSAVYFNSRLHFGFNTQIARVSSSGGTPTRVLNDSVTNEDPSPVGAASTSPPTTAAPTTTTLPPAIPTDSRVATRANEPSMAINPKNSRDILIAYNTVTSEGDIGCGYARSLDGGSHWNYGTLAQPSGLTYGLGDPSVAFAPDGRAFLSCLSGADADAPLLSQFGLSRVDASALVVATAPAGSVTFGTPVVVAQDLLQHKFFNKKDNIIGSQLDMEHIAVSPVTRRAIMCYTEVTYTKGAFEQRINVVYALDTSATLWSSPQLVSSAAETKTIGCTVAVTGSGRVWAAYWNTKDDGARAIWSDTNGRRWSKPQTLGPKTITTSINDEVVGWRVNVAADPNPGSTRAVAAWASTDLTGARAAVQLVTTDGTTWSQPRSVSDPSVTVTRQPAVAFGQDGIVALGYYDQVGDTVTYDLEQSAWPGTAPFGLHKAVASAPSRQNVTFDAKPFDPPRLGDYTAVAEADGKAFASWGDDRVGDQLEVWFGS